VRSRQAPRHPSDRAAHPLCAQPPDYTWSNYPSQ
jgi:hypothetical protein